MKSNFTFALWILTKGNIFVLKVAKRKYQQEYDIAPPITFDGDQVALDVPEDGTKTDNGWEIVPVQKAHASVVKVKNPFRFWI